MKFFDRQNELKKYREIRERAQEDCENEFTNGLDFYEVKRESRRFDEQVLRGKVDSFLKKNPTKTERNGHMAGLSLDDM